MKARPIIIIIITLTLGFVLGVLVSSRIRYHRLKPVRLFFSEERFREGFYNVIQPDERQRETIEQLLSKYAKTNSSIQNDFRKKLDSTMKDFWNEMEPVLSREQVDRLRQMEQRRIQMYRQNQRNHRDSTDFRERGRRGMPPTQPHGDPRPSFHEKRDTSGL